MSTYAGPVLQVGVVTVLPRDFENGSLATGTITGTAKVQIAANTVVPIRCQVVLFRDHDHQPVRSMITDAANGVFSFSGIDKHLTYTAIAFHPTLAYRAVLADGVYPT